MEADYDRIRHQLRPMEPRLWPAARLSAPDLASPLSAISEFDNLAGASWSELERSGQICPNRVVSLKRGQPEVRGSIPAEGSSLRDGTVLNRMATAL